MTGGDAPVCVDTKYIDARFSDHKHVHEAEHRALDAASSAVDARLASMNEFRNALTDQTKMHVTHTTFEAYLSGVNAQMDALRTEAQRSAIAAGIIGIIGGIIIVKVLGI